MKNFKILSNALLLFSILYLFESCKKPKETAIDNKIQLSTAVKLENGYLAFRDQQAFDSIGNLLINKTPDELAKWESQFDQFKSYRSIFRKVQRAYDDVNDQGSLAVFKRNYGSYFTLNTDSSLTYKFGTPFSAYFINGLGEVKVGDEHRKYSDHMIMVYTGKHRSMDEIALASDVKIYQVRKSIMLNPIEQKIASVKEASAKTALTNGIIQEEHYYNGDRDRRLRVELWYEYIPPTHVVTITGQTRFYFVVLQELKRTFGGWRANNTDYYRNSINVTWETFAAAAPFNIHTYNVGYLANPNTTGPLIYSTDTFSRGECVGINGTASFTTGGVPSTPTFYINH